MIRSETLRRVQGLARTPVLQAMRVGVLVLCGNPALFAGIRPVSAALTAAALASGWHPLVVLMGASGGCLMNGWSPGVLASLLGNGLMMAVWTLLGLRQSEKRAGQREGQAVLLGCFGGCAQLLTLLSGYSQQALIICLASALTAAMLAPCLLGALSLSGKRTLLMPDEQLSILLLGALAVSGLNALPGAGIYLGGLAAAVVTLLGAYCGAAEGALTGVCVGLALAAQGGSLSLAAALSLCGALAGAVRRIGRCAMGGALMSGLVLGLLFEQTGVAALSLIPTLCGALVFALLPSEWTRRVQGLMRTKAVSPDAQTLSVRLRERAARQTRRLSRAFEGLHEGYAACRTQMPSEVGLIRQMREALCSGCDDYKRCWQGERGQAGRLLCRMMSEAATGRPLTTAAQLPPDATRHCRRSTQIDRRVQPILTRFVAERNQALQKSGLRGLIGQQMEQASGLLSRLSAQLSRPVCLDEECARLARAALERAGIVCREVLAVDEEHLEILATPENGAVSACQARQAAQVLSEEMGLLLSVQLDEPTQGRLRFVPAPRYELLSAARQQTAHGQMCCGDSCRIAELTGERVMLALCDGMGSGEVAHEQSAAALELMERFLQAGVALDAALSSVNDVLMARGGECFTTLDLCVIDLRRGIADFCKLGAADSWILREGGIEAVPGGRLPMGILDEVTPSRQRRTLQPGDQVVLLSDGVCDPLREGQADRLRRCLPRLRALPPGQAAALLVEQAAQRDGGACDDLTALVGRLQALPAQKTDENRQKSTLQTDSVML